jgi:hypothetical protein
VNFESTRRKLAWVCTTVFAVSFVGLLAISTTPYWTPDNAWTAYLDVAWRLSGLLGIALWLLPRIAGAGRRVAQLFSGGA